MVQSHVSTYAAAATWIRSSSSSQVWHSEMVPQHPWVCRKGGSYMVVHKEVGKCLFVASNSSLCGHEMCTERKDSRKMQHLALRTCKHDSCIENSRKMVLPGLGVREHFHNRIAWPWAQHSMHCRGCSCCMDALHARHDEASRAQDVQVECGLENTCNYVCCSAVMCTLIAGVYKHGTQRCQQAAAKKALLRAFASWASGRSIGDGTDFCCESCFFFSQLPDQI